MPVPERDACAAKTGQGLESIENRAEGFIKRETRTELLTDPLEQLKLGSAALFHLIESPVGNRGGDLSRQHLGQVALGLSDRSACPFVPDGEQPNRLILRPQGQQQGRPTALAGEYCGEGDSLSRSGYVLNIERLAPADLGQERWRICNRDVAGHRMGATIFSIDRHRAQILRVERLGQAHRAMFRIKR